MTHRPPDWARIARFSLVVAVVLAVVLFFAIPDHRWIAALVLVLGLVDCFFLARVMPRLSATNTSDELTETNPQAEAEADILDGDWGVPPPSEPAKPGD